MFRSSTQKIASKLESLRAAERRLLVLAEQFGSDNNPIEIRTLDTAIPRSTLAWKEESKRRLALALDEREDELRIHSVQAYAPRRKNRGAGTNETAPLVLLHGYMNASAYFYRNLAGLAQHFDSVHSLDMLGWGLSSRPDFELAVRDKSVKAAEDFYVESLEAWRIQQKMDKMVLLGHSMGGYLSVAYCERYPEHVERLILLSPVGVNDENSPTFAAREQRIKSSYSTRFMFGVFRTLFEQTTVGGVLRALPEHRSYGMAAGYVQRRLPAIDTKEEQEALADYLYHSNTLPGSGEYALQRILHPTVLARQPLQYRIPNLKVNHVTMLYGSHDWMDLYGGVATKALCDNAASSSPKVDVRVVRDAGHLLMLENWQGVNDGIVDGSRASLGNTSSHLLIPPILSLEEVLVASGEPLTGQRVVVETA